MRIGIIGAGRIGSTLAGHLDRIGHEVAISNSRGPETLSGLVAELGGSVRAVTAREAAEFGEPVVVAVPYGAYRELPAEELRDKVVIDTCNYYPERDGHDPDLDADRTTSSERIQAHTGGNLVKAFNAIHWEDLRDRARPPGDPERVAIPLSGSDSQAKAVVSGVIDEIGFAPVIAGDLGGGGRRHQPGTSVYGALLPADETSALLRAH
ncbi:NAD(P)-binding domain-containing protein [Streptomyces sp. TRM70308]|uniref:NADPH-dependent F420 reductase n=1 Tax=Streptomyces sp. TRM70308 TaxID=3131932 RepID=UPI003CFBEBEB